MEMRRNAPGTRAGLVAAALGAALLVPGVLRGQSIPVTVGGPASSLVGVPFELPITVDLSGRTDRLGAFSIRIQWNPAVFAMDSGVNGDFGEVEAFEDSMPLGVLRLAGVNPDGVAGRMSLGIGYARPLLADTTTIRVQVMELYAARTFLDLLPSALVTNRPYCPARGRFGDLSPDGAITALDAQIALMSAVGQTLPPATDVTVGDVDGDGLTDTRDALVMLSRVVGLETSPFRRLRVAPGACGTDRILSLTLKPGDQTVLVGQDIQYIARVVDSTGTPAPAAEVTWTSTDPTVATVNEVGKVTTLATGSTVITAKESGGHLGSATVTVVGRRSQHWVDALAFNNTNHLGTPEQPFAAIQDAMAVAQPGDSVMVRRGRYEGPIDVSQSVAIIGVPDSLGVKPLITGRPDDYYYYYGSGGGINVNAGARILLKALRFDTLFQAVVITAADTVIIEDSDFRSRQNSYYSLRVDSVGALYVRRSRFDGAGSDYGDNALYLYGHAGLVSVDSTLVTDFGDDGLVLYGVDSLVVRSSVFRYNQGYAVHACNYCYGGQTAVAAVFSRNRWTQNEYGHVYLDDYATAAFDHNVMDGGGYDAIQLYGDSASVASLRGDSIRARDYGTWLHVAGYDSVGVDSVAVAVEGYGDSFYDGRILAITNSAFRDLQGTAISVYPYSPDTARLVLRNVEFTGGANCDRCGYAVEASQTLVDAQNVTGSNLYRLFNVYQGALTLRDATVDRSYRGVYVSCASARIDLLTVTDVDYGVESYGCVQSDSMVVDSSSFTDAYRAAYSQYGTLVFTQNVVSGAQYGVDDYYGPLLVRGNTFQDILYEGVGSSGTALDSVVVESNAITCLNAPYSYYYGIIVSDATVTRVLNNTVAGCPTGINVASNNANLPLGAPVEIRGNTITPGSSSAVVVSGSRGTFKIAQNTVTGAPSGSTTGSIYVAGASHKVEVDSNTVTGSSQYGIDVTYAPDSLHIRGNAINAHAGGTANRTSAIYLAGGAVTNQVAEVSGNRITGSKGSGIVLYRSYGAADPVRVLVDSNTVKGADSVGIWVGYSSKATVRKNAIDSTGADAVRLQELFVGDTAVVVNANNLTRSKRYGINNLTTLFIDGTGNWWNHTDGPGGTYGVQLPDPAADSVSNYVNYTPWATAKISDIPVPAPPLVAAAPPLGVPSAAPTTRGTPPPAPPAAPARPARREWTPPARHPRPDTQGLVDLPAGDRLRDQALERRLAERREQAAARAAREAARAQAEQKGGAR